jgi:hypothetical protein
MTTETSAVREHDPAEEALPEWTMKYPEEYRELLKIFGVDDRGRRTLEGFNDEVIETLKRSRGQRFVFKTLMGYMYEDWHHVLSRHERRNEIEDAAGRASAPEAEGPGPEGGETSPEMPIDAESLGRIFHDKGAAHYLALRSGVSFRTTPCAGSRRAATARSSRSPTDRSCRSPTGRRSTGRIATGGSPTCSGWRTCRLSRSLRPS